MDQGCVLAPLVFDAVQAKLAPGRLSRGLHDWFWHGLPAWAFSAGSNRKDIERLASELAGIPQFLNRMLLTPAEASSLGFRCYAEPDGMLRHFADFRRPLSELRETGFVSLDAAVEPITQLLSER